MPKPVAVRLEDATATVEAVQGKIHCAVFYIRTGYPFYETLKQIMDTMIHTLNIVRYLMAGEVTSCCFFSHNYAQNLRCNDTEFLKVDFSGGGSAYLFITWAELLA